MILLRHGQSVFNLRFHETGRDPGLPDAPLTPLGHAQAAAAAEALAAEDIRRVLCSPYTRALQTAVPVARRLGLTVTVTPAVRERFSASCDIGTARAGLCLAWPALDFSGCEEVWWPDLEEPQERFQARAARFRDEMAALPGRAHTLVVCHWGFIRALTGRDAGNGEWVRLPPEPWEPA